jgi:hypothetical protein
MTHAAEKIRAWLATAYPTDSARLGNISDESIRKIVSPEFKKIQDSKKQ